jgi:predicted Rossmann fold flavoprotein
MIYDVIVIGGGPAGLMASNIFEKYHLNYLLLEKNEKLGKKLLITGGKRCNVTNNLSPEQFVENLTFKHKRFLFGALSDFGPKEIINYFNSKGLKLVLEDQFKYFPETGKSSSVLEALESGIDANRIHLKQFVKEIHVDQHIFHVKTSNESFYAKHVVVATGSNSYPSTGSNGDGLIFAKYLGIESTPFTPAETHLYSKYVKEKLADLQGVSIPNVKVKLVGTKIAYTGGLLFTHFGLSGPVILHISEHVYEESIRGEAKVSFGLTELNANELNQLFDQEKKNSVYILKVLETLTTKKLAKKVLDLVQVDNRNINEIAKKDLNQIIELMTNFTILIDKVEDKDKAFVNRGGVLTSELDPQSMESKKVKGLHFIGETVDLHGPIGGFNITIAMSTGYRCAHSIISNIKKS